MSQFQFVPSTKDLLSFLREQNLTTEQQEFVREKIGAGTGESGGGLVSFETLSQSFNAYPKAINYSSGRVSSVVYTLPNSSTITKTINYTGDKVTSVVLSGATPPGIALTKTFTYSGDDLVGVAYA
jgi:hypothetical protein